MSALEIILHDEVQFLDFGESRSAGPWIKLRLKDPDQLHTFRSLNPKECPVFNLTLSAGPILADEQHQSPDVKQANQDQSVDAKAPYGEQARTLRLSSFFRTPQVWRAVGTDAEFLEGLRHRVCALFLDHGYECQGDVVAAHVRRIANGAGTGIKPPYSAIPLCAYHHGIQHQQGETALKPKEWYDEKRIYYLQMWCWQKLKADLGYEHWNEMPPSVLQAWAGQKSLGHLLPSGYVQ